MKARLTVWLVVFMVLCMGVLCHADKLYMNADGTTWDNGGVFSGTDQVTVSGWFYIDNEYDYIITLKSYVQILKGDRIVCTLDLDLPRVDDPYPYITALQRIGYTTYLEPAGGQYRWRRFSVTFSPARYEMEPGQYTVRFRANVNETRWQTADDTARLTVPGICFSAEKQKEGMAAVEIVGDYISPEDTLVAALYDNQGRLARVHMLSADEKNRGGADLFPIENLHADMKLLHWREAPGAMLPVGEKKLQKDISLTVGSYNIHNGADVAYDYAVLAKDITGANLDIVGLQEVDQCTQRNGNRDTLKLLSEASGYPYYAFCKAIDHQGGGYGTGILSKYPIIAYETIALPSADVEARSAAHAVINVDGTLVDFFNTHLSYESLSVRTEQFAVLKSFIGNRENVIVTADFNTGDFSEFSSLGLNLTSNENNKLLSFGGTDAIDNILYSNTFTLVGSGVRDDYTHSDHHMIWGKYRLQTEKKPLYRIGSYAISAGSDVGFDYSMIARDIKDAGVCLVGLQMVDQNTDRNKNQDTMKILSEATGLSYYAYSPCIDLGGGAYGTGILSKYPIESYETMPLYSGSGEQRALGHGIITMGGKKVHVFNTHLSHDNEAVRNEQLGEIAAFLVGKEPYLFTGSFNTGRLSDFEKFPGGVPASRTSGGTASLDNIVYTSAFSLKNYGEMNLFPHASHNLFWAEFTME